MLETEKKQREVVTATAGARGASRSRTGRGKGTAWFLAIAFGGSWAWILGGYFGLGLSMVNPLAQLPFGVMPALAAIVVRRWITKEGFADAGLALRLRRAWPYYLAAWLGPLVFAAGACGLAAALGLWHPDLSPLDKAAGGLPAWVFVALLMLVVPLLTPVYAGEEFGWTGYLRPSLRPERRPALATVVTGLIWAVWHFPLAFTDYVTFTHTPVGLVVWAAGFLLQEVLLAWLYTRSGSIWVVSLAHAGNNMILFLLTGTLLGTEGGATAGGGGLGATGVTLMTMAPIGVACACAMLPSLRSSLRGGRRG
ncbi:CPBP family intramembrane glutamic endopeptidase [Streptomyces sp. UNOC14_S4]|uniref:CPBP family intramembrane glutamic endopeptidase n=1 Tax=Streptomyces sp. UNOC14_S4 TaxID=2872340 RepID=UPI001E5F79BF|nr:type II CAAX endopeptidase family protein [Streptomyces sp. UNOC14_S4]